MLNRVAASVVMMLASVACAQEKKPWTVLVYGAADNNADGPILEFMDGVRRAIDDDPGIDLLFFIDRSEGYSKDSRFLGEDFTGARLYRLRRDSAERLAGGEQFPEITLDRDVELNSADAANIGKFIAWGKATSPADRYALLIYSHANGRTMCPDEECKGDMGIAELTDEVGPEGRVDFLALELCGMGGIEIAYQWRPDGGRFSADVLLAIPNAGPPLDWDRAFARIRTPGHDTSSGRRPFNPTRMTGADFGRLIIEEGYAGRLESERRGRNVAHESAAAYDLARAADVKKSVDALARALHASESRDAFLGIRDEHPINYSGGGAYVDLYDLCGRAAASEALGAEVRASASATMLAIDEFVIASFGMSGYENFEPGRNGVYIVLPGTGEEWHDFGWYTMDAGTGADYGRWAFLRDGATPGNGEVENWYELLDAWFDGAGANSYEP